MRQASLRRPLKVEFTFITVSWFMQLYLYLRTIIRNFIIKVPQNIILITHNSWFDNASNLYFVFFSITVTVSFQFRHILSNFSNYLIFDSRSCSRNAFSINFCNQYIFKSFFFEAHVTNILPCKDQDKVQRPK